MNKKDMGKINELNQICVSCGIRYWLAYRNKDELFGKMSYDFSPIDYKTNSLEITYSLNEALYWAKGYQTGFNKGKQK